MEKIIKNEFLKNLTDAELNDLENEINLVKRINIIKLFLKEETINFIMNYYPTFLTKIEIESINKSAKFYLENENIDYNTLIKWAPIFLDKDRVKLIISYLKNENSNIKEITNFLSHNIKLEIETADKLHQINDKIPTIDDNEFLETSVEIAKMLNHNKVNNEGFNNLINENIKKHEPLLRRLT